MKIKSQKREQYIFTFIFIFTWRIFSLVFSFLLIFRCVFSFLFFSFPAPHWNINLQQRRNYYYHYYNYFYSCESFFHQRKLMVFHRSLRDSKTPQIFKILLSILASNNREDWMVSTHPLISKSSRPYINPFGDST